MPRNLLDVKEMTDDKSTWFTISLTLAFTTTCMKRVSTTLDLFQSRQRQTHLVASRLNGLVSYYDMLSKSQDHTDFGIQSVIQGKPITF